MEYIGIQKKNGGVVEALQQAILSGQIPAGTEMTQNELAESLGVSRMPVREALMILEYQGLIIRLPNNRIKAADLTEETLRQILALGAQLERQAMRALPQDAMLAGGEMLQHRILRFKFRLLGKKLYCPVFCQDHLARIRLFQSAEDPQKSRFPGSVNTDDPDFFPFLQIKGSIRKQQSSRI